MNKESKVDLKLMPIETTEDLSQADKKFIDTIVHMEPGSVEQSPIPATYFLNEAGSAMKARAKLRDTSEGERTAKKIAEVFNSITDHNITEADAWMFLVVLKIVRSRAGKFNADDYIDLAAYASLLGECESINRPEMLYKAGGTD